MGHTVIAQTWSLSILGQAPGMPEAIQGSSGVLRTVNFQSRHRSGNYGDRNHEPGKIISHCQRRPGHDPQGDHRSNDWTVDRLARFFTDKGISGAPVVDESRRLVGVVTLSDIVRQTGSGTVDMERRDDDFYNSLYDSALSEEDQRAFHESVDQSVMVNDIMTPMVFEVALKPL